VIPLHRAGGGELYVNADLIETVEADDDGRTTVVLTTGNAFVVEEDPEWIATLVVEFRQRIGLRS
jgi:uncharacterized protein YlzI (FlbEa/FlbD family)